MTKLHIVQGGIENGDLDWIRSAAPEDTSVPWVIPKNAEVGDDVVLYVGKHGFVATGSVATRPKSRLDWPNRYGAKLTDVRQIRPSITLDTIRAALPDFDWAKYPRSITTPQEDIALRIRSLIDARRTEAGRWSARNADEDLKAASRELSLVDETTREALVQARRGQGVFRQALVAYWKGCSMTGSIFLPALRASHIKPWRACSNGERLDKFNGLLLLGTHDLLFDAGLIAFSSKGELLIAKTVPKGEWRRLGINERMRLRRLEGPHHAYLAWHRERLFEAIA